MKILYLLNILIPYDCKSVFLGQKIANFDSLEGSMKTTIEKKGGKNGHSAITPFDFFI